MSNLEHRSLHQRAIEFGVSDWIGSNGSWNRAAFLVHLVCDHLPSGYYGRLLTDHYSHTAMKYAFDS